MPQRSRPASGGVLALALCLALTPACQDSASSADASVTPRDTGIIDLGTAFADARAPEDAAEPDAGEARRDAELMADAPAADVGSPDAEPAAEDAAVGSPDAGPECPSLVGFPCTQNDQCDPGHVCLTPSTFSPTLGPPAGYCSRTCTSDPDCGPCGVCNEDPGGEGIRICLRTCLPGGRCEVAGQLCNRIPLGIVPTSTSVCFPGDPGARIGDACRVASDCGANQGCYNAHWIVGGICVGEACSRDTPDTCPTGSRCGRIRNRDYCLPECLPDGTCSRPDYTCVTDSNTCAQRFGYQEPGTTCSVDSDCGGPNTGLSCLRDATHPEGYCTRFDCAMVWPECSPYICQSYEESCPFLSTCTMMPDMSRTYCARRCDVGVTCLQPYTCVGSICQ